MVISGTASYRMTGTCTVSRTKINRNRRATERFDANQFPDQELAAQVSQMGVNAGQYRP